MNDAQKKMAFVFAVFIGGVLFLPLLFKTQLNPYSTAQGLSTPPPLSPSSEFLFGSDDRGRDLLSRVVFGARNSFLFALFTTLGTFFIGTFVGAFLGYKGGKWDLFGQRALEVLAALPVLYIALFVFSRLSSDLFSLVLFWVLVGWIGIAIYVRGEVLALREREFLRASEMMGVGFPRIFFKHLIPALFPLLLALFPYTFSNQLVILTGLDFLGVGLPIPEPSLGEILRQGHQNLSAWWLVVFPGLILLFFVFLCHELSEILRKLDDIGRYKQTKS
jgi:microcin C transport system permease protein